MADARAHAELADRGALQNRSFQEGVSRCVSRERRTLTSRLPQGLRETVDDQAVRADDAESRLPTSRGQRLAATELTPDGHATNPPARYTEASLIKASRAGIGARRPTRRSSRPSRTRYVHKKAARCASGGVRVRFTGAAFRVSSTMASPAMEDSSTHRLRSGATHNGSTTSTSAATTAWPTRCTSRWPQELVASTSKN